MTVEELLKRMSSSEFSEWMAYYNIEPFGHVREDLRAGMIASPLLNAWTAKGRKTKPSEWLMKFDPPEPQDWKEMKTILKAFAEAKQKKAEADVHHSNPSSGAKG